MKDKHNVTRRTCFLAILWLILVFVGPELTGETRELFPERERLKKQSRHFFKQVDTAHPLLERVDFFARSGAYRSAYLALVRYIPRNTYLKTLLPAFAKTHPATQPPDPSSSGASRLIYFLSTLHGLGEDYRANALSGDRAYREWNRLLEITNAVYREAGKKKGKTLDNAAILEISSHLVFFKNHKKWRKRAARVLKMLKKNGTATKDLYPLIFGGVESGVTP